LQINNPGNGTLLWSAFAKLLRVGTGLRFRAFGFRFGDIPHGFKLRQRPDAVGGNVLRIDYREQPDNRRDTNHSVSCGFLRYSNAAIEPNDCCSPGVAGGESYAQSSRFDTDKACWIAGTVVVIFRGNWLSGAPVREFHATSLQIRRSTCPSTPRMTAGDYTVSSV